MINLTLNARDAMPKGGKLIIETDNVTLDEAYARLRPDVIPGEYVMIAVSDTGVGIDEQTKSRVFDPFFTTKPVGEGTGLGLATCFGIIKQAGGYIWVYSEREKGSTFKIYLPRVTNGREDRSVWKASTELPRGTETILVAEDEPLVRDMTVRILRAQGYTVLDAGNGAEAMELLTKFHEPLHLLLTDVVMPQMGGIELAERLENLLPTLKTLYISGFTEGAIATQGGLESDKAFLHKPFTAAALAQAVRHVLDDEPIG